MIRDVAQRFTTDVPTFRKQGARGRRTARGPRRFGPSGGRNGFRPPRAVLAAIAAALPVVTAGCGIGGGSGGNGVFVDTTVVSFGPNGTASLKGNVGRIGELDIVTLGPLSAGDRLIIDAQTANSPLDVSIAVFDDQNRLVFANDDRGGPAGRFLDSYGDFIIRHDGDDYTLVVTHSAFAARSTFTGNYDMILTLIPDVGVPQPVAQVLLLDYAGGTIATPALGPATLDPFNAADISLVYQGQTAVVKASIRETVEQNFERFNVVVITSDDGPVPTGVEVSTLFIGGFNDVAFGEAESVDLYNADFCDDAIIYAESFTPSVFGDVPTADELGVAIGNVTAHEAGHLLGLNHVDDDRALMDDQSAADVFLTDQEFMQGPLSVDVMPYGTQDAVLLLMETVGARQ
ncbi:MAG: matrixin family metalloprotease [Phycisphaerae bacterium]